MKYIEFVFVILLSSVILVLTACNVSTITSTTTLTTTAYASTSVITSTITLPATAELALADDGFVHVDGKGDFTYRRISYPVTAPVTYQNVTFTPNNQTVTMSGPIVYWFIVEFADGSSEQLEYVGLRPSNFTLDITLTKHTNPTAGVMLSWQTLDNEIQPVIYLLVSSN
jgi:hypothetical protein